MKKGDIQEKNLFSFSDVLPDKKIQSTIPPMNNVGYQGTHNLSTLCTDRLSVCNWKIGQNRLKH